jgi:hypothetical protein
MNVYDLVSDHIGQYFDNDDVLVFDELESPDFHMDTYLIKPDGERAFCTLLTCGVSSIPMNVPDPRCNPYVELMLLLPESWPFANDQWKEPENYWPIELVKSIGRFPHDNHTWIGMSHTIPESKSSYLYSRGFVATILLKSLAVSMDFQQIPHSEGAIDILLPIPLTEKEYLYKKEKRLDAFLEKAVESGYPDIVDLGRKSIV